MSLQLRLFLLLLLLATSTAWAQGPVPRWTTASVNTSNSPRTYPWPHAVATDATGNVYTAGMFNDTVTFGRYTLHSAGQSDFYVAKYAPATGSWAWAVRGGGLASDVAYGLTVHQGCVYITGYLQNNLSNDNGVTLDSSQPVPQPGAANAPPSSDLFVAKYIDHGSRATLAWCQVAGGSDMDYGLGIAVSERNVYVTGTITNDRANRQSVVFGSGMLPGPWQPLGVSPQFGTLPTPHNDLVLAKYTDHGSRATFDWSQAAGGRFSAVGRAVAVQGRSVYVVGDLVSDRTDSAYVCLGGHGWAPGVPRLLAAGRRWFQSWLLVKYTDLGDHAAVGWSQVAGSNGSGSADQVAVSGRNVYVLGDLGKSHARVLRIQLGDGRTVAVTDPTRRTPQSGAAAMLVKYADDGPTSRCVWLRVDGTNDYFYEGTSLVASGPWVYTLCYSFFNRTHTRQRIRGGTRRRRGTQFQGDAPYDVKDRPYIAGYYDEGPRATLRWVRVFDYRFQMSSRYFWLGLSGPHLYVVGNTWLPASFGRFTLTAPEHSFGFVVAGLDLSPTLVEPVAKAR